ncbi:MULTISPECIES: DUF4174 domain-containing protein [Mycobacteriaceae]|uniref:DUF4174 domain-containing protein n=1 Tax=Mycolicibacterium parafortuitum TaxID=39692 RepID=A0ACC6MBW9_MYCPF|nr:MULTISPECIES: DUF4174 domain-containing protein [Mycobacteriaceae]MDZ5084396.1 DUF4174 domain-containing protein [Mycolicibacterium parafortuitum]
MSAGLGSGTAVAAELGDYRWEHRPLLLFAPANSDPRLVETLSRIDANRCDVLDRDMVVGVVVGEGTSTLDGQVIDTQQTQQLMGRYGVGDTDFTVVLIGKDGGEKWRVNDVPSLRTVFAVIDGMPMRNREMAADPGRC